MLSWDKIATISYYKNMFVFKFEKVINLFRKNLLLFRDRLKLEIKNKK